MKPRRKIFLGLSSLNFQTYWFDLVNINKQLYKVLIHAVNNDLIAIVSIIVDSELQSVFVMMTIHANHTGTHILSDL